MRTPPAKSPRCSPTCASCNPATDSLSPSCTTRRRAPPGPARLIRIHAWGDSNLYLRRHGDDLSLTVEHRAAASIAPIALQLQESGDALALGVGQRGKPIDPPAASVEEKIIRALEASAAPLPLAPLRASCQVRTATLCAALAALAKQTRVEKAAAGYRLAKP